MLRKIRNLWRSNRGESGVSLILIVPAIFLLVALVVDGGGKINSDTEATLIAQSAARSAVNAGISSGPDGIVINNYRARAAANQYLQQEGTSGHVVISGNKVTVRVNKHYDSKLRPADFTGRGTGSAEARSSSTR